MRIGIAYSLAPPAADRPLDGPDDRYEEFDKPETVEAIAAAIRAAGHDVTLLGDGREFLTRVLADPPDFVFNIAEGEGVGRCREARVPAACEMLGIPYSGSDPLTLAACLDKSVAKRLVMRSTEWSTPFSVALSIPESCLLPRNEAVAIRLLEKIFADGGLTLPFVRSTKPPPVILKPSFEGSSKGIRGTALASTVEEAISVYRELVVAYDQPILLEEFIDGDELTVGVIGSIVDEWTSKARVLGIMRVVPKRADGPFVYSLEVKRDWTNRVTYQAPADYTAEVVEAIEEATLRVFNSLGCRDCARIDFRLGVEGLYFIEANPLPGLAPETSDLVILAEGYGMSHGELVRKILDVALARVGLA